MQVKLLAVGKTQAAYLQEGIDLYTRRIGHYLPYQMQIVPEVKASKKLRPPQQAAQEGEKLLAQVGDRDFLVLLDERGPRQRSVEFAAWLQAQMLANRPTLVFAIGGPYGVSPAVYDRADAQLSLSPMTLSHQLVRLVFVEQLYRALTILRGEPYHHE